MKPNNYLQTESHWERSRAETLMDFMLSDNKHIYIPTNDGVTYVSPKYTFTERKSFSSQREVIEAWMDMQFPLHNVTSNRYSKDVFATLYSSGNFEAEQHVDGHGIVYHYNTISDIRTKQGDYITNSDDWSAGFAHETHVPHSERLATLPLTRISGLAGFSRKDLYNITSVHTDTMLDGTTSRDSLVRFSDGRGLLIFRDNSSHEDALCFLEVSESEMKGKHSVYELKKDVLTPEPVKVAEAKGMKVVPTNKMVAWKGNYEPGDVIQRQGEYFAIPEPDYKPKNVVKILNSRNEGFSRPRNPMDSHIPREVSYHIPSECEMCHSTSFDVSEHFVCTECGNICDKLFARGSVRHSRNEHYVMRLGETWHSIHKHDKTVWIEGPTGRGGWD